MATRALFTLLLFFTPQIQEEIEANYGVGVVSAGVIAALFMVTNGADIHIKNTASQSPLSLCAVDVAPLFKEYSERRSLIFPSAHDVIAQEKLVCLFISMCHDIDFSLYLDHNYEAALK